MYRNGVMLLITCIMVSGCMVRTTDRPTVLGRVIDSGNVPISNATVRVETTRFRIYPGPKPDEGEVPPGLVPVAETLVSTDGHFKIKGHGNWGFFFPPMDLFPYERNAHITITAPGYHVVEREIWYEGDFDTWGIGHLVQHDLGEVQLKRSDAN